MHEEIKLATKGAGMDYPGNISPDDFMARIVKVLNKEVMRGYVYPLMARYSKRTCDREYLKGSDYLCVNIKVDCNRNTEIFAVDIYPNETKRDIVLTLFRRKGKKSLYKMTNGTEDENSERDEMVGRMVEKSSKESPLHGFSRREDGFKRMEKKMQLTWAGNLINSIVDEVVKIVSAVRGNR